jgi:hypothetical protein
MQLSELRVNDLFALCQNRINDKNKFFVLNCQSLLSDDPNATEFQLNWLSTQSIDSKIKLKSQTRLVKDSNANPNYLLFICNQGESVEIALQAVTNLLQNPNTFHYHLKNAGWNSNFFEVKQVASKAYLNNIHSDSQDIRDLIFYNRDTDPCTTLDLQKVLLEHKNASIEHYQYLCEKGETVDIALQAVNKLLGSSEVNWRSLNHVMKHGKNGTAEIAEGALQTDYYRSIEALIPV